MFFVIFNVVGFSPEIGNCIFLLHKMFNGGQSEYFVPKIRKKEMMSALTISIQHSLGSFTQYHKAGKENKNNQIERNKKLGIFTENMTVNIKKIPFLLSHRIF